MEVLPYLQALKVWSSNALAERLVETSAWLVLLKNSQTAPLKKFWLTMRANDVRGLQRPGRG